MTKDLEGEFPDTLALLRCLGCGNELAQNCVTLSCLGCGAAYSIAGGIPRFVPEEIRDDSAAQAGDAAVKSETAASFAYEWARFGATRPEWRRNFFDYMQPHSPEFFRGLTLLDVGTGSGRHARVASEHGARVVAVDLGDAIEVARRNLPADVLTVQADAEALPFAPGSFDFVMSIGVLHHLPDTARALRSIVGQAKPGGWVRVYLYWKPERRSHRLILSMVGAARLLTTRLPHPVLHAFCYPVAAVLWLAIVQPYALLSRRRATQRLADAFPLKTYADYPFGVLLNDQFDRFSAPIERRFEREEVVDLLRQAGLSRIAVWAHHGWLAEGVREPAHGVDQPR